MNALTAPIQHVEPSEILFVVPLAPLASAAINGLFGRRIAEGRGARATNTIAVVGCLAALAALVTVLFGVDADHRFFFSHLWSFLRVGSLSASVDLAADPLGIGLGVVVLVLAGVGHLDLVAEEASPVMHARVSLLSGGLLLAVLGGGFPSMLLGFGIATFATAALVSGRFAPRVLSAGHVADACLLAGAVVLFWGLGGGFGIALGNEPSFTRHNPEPGGIQELDLDEESAAHGPSLLPVVSSAAPAPAPAKPGSKPDFSAKGKISLPGWAGAKVFLRGSTNPAAVAPVLGIESYAGRLDIAVERPGMPRVMLHAVEVPANGELSLVPIGPTLSFREIADQLTLVDANHKRFVRNVLDPAVPGHRRIFGTSVVTVAALLFALAAITRSALLPFLATGPVDVDGEPRTRAIVLSLAPIAGVYVVARLSPVFALAGAPSVVLLLVAALSAVSAAAIAASREKSVPALRAAIGAQGALAIAGAAAGAYGAAVLHAIVIALSGTCLILLQDLPRGARTRTLSMIATLAFAGAPIPLLGVAWSREPLLQRMFAADVPLHAGHLAWIFGVAAVGLVAHAACRVHAGTSAEDGELSAIDANVLLALGVAAAIVGPLFSISRGSIGVGPERPLFSSWLAPDLERILGERAPVSVDVGRAVELSIAVVTLAVAALAGRAGTRGAHLPLPGLEALARVPAAIFAGFVEGIGAVARFVEWVLDLPLRLVASRRAR